MGRPLRLLLLQLVLFCGLLLAEGELYAYVSSPFQADTLQYNRSSDTFSLRVEPARSPNDPPRQTLQWTGWQWVQPLGARGSDRQPFVPRLELGRPDTIQRFRFDPLHSSADLEPVPTGNEWWLMGNPYLDPIDLSWIESDPGENGPESGYLWDRDRQSFRPLGRREQIYPGDVFLFKREGESSVRLSGPGLRAQSSSVSMDDASRFIRFTLSNRISSRSSDATIQFEEGAEVGPDPLDLEAIVSGLALQEYPDAPKLYFQSTLADSARWFTRDARPYDLQLPMELSLGFVSRRDSGPHHMEWELGGSIPEDWEVELTDLFTQQRIDLRERQGYRFDGEGAVLAEGTLDRDQIRSLLLEEPFQRFQLRISPPSSESFAGSLSQVQQDPDEMELHPNYPNPFSMETSIEFFVPEETPVSLNIYNVVGQRVAQLMSNEPVQGWHTEVWTAGELPSGIYILRLETARGVLTRKMTLIR